MSVCDVFNRRQDPQSGGSWSPVWGIRGSPNDKITFVKFGVCVGMW